MTAIASLLSTAAPVALGASPATAPATGLGGAVSLTAFLDLMMPGDAAVSIAVGEKGAPAEGERQAFATTGKELPVGDAAPGDAALAWLGMAMGIQIPQATPTADATATVATPPVDTIVVGAAASATPTGATTTLPAFASVAPALASAAVAIPAASSDRTAPTLAVPTTPNAATSSADATRSITPPVDPAVTAPIVPDRPPLKLVAANRPAALTPEPTPAPTRAAPPVVAPTTPVAPMPEAPVAAASIIATPATASPVTESPVTESPVASTASTAPIRARRGVDVPIISVPGDAPPATTTAPVAEPSRELADSPIILVPGAAQPTTATPIAKRPRLADVPIVSIPGDATPAVLRHTATAPVIAPPRTDVAATVTTRATAPQTKGTQTVLAPQAPAALAPTAPIAPAPSVARPVAATPIVPAPVAPSEQAPQPVVEAAPRDTAPARAAPQPVAAQPQVAQPAQPAIAQAAIAPAAQVFADAIHRAASDDAQPAPDTSLAAANLAATGAVTHAAVVATGHAQQGALDMRDGNWPQTMVDRIVALRDMAAENDTSIRLVPDALGKIDISLRHDGDSVQVRISAEQAQTRQLIAEAQPRLTELAAERGVKLSHAGGSFAGTGGEAQRQGAQQQQQQPNVPSAPPRARQRAEESAKNTDERVA